MRTLLSSVICLGALVTAGPVIAAEPEGSVPSSSSEASEAPKRLTAIGSDSMGSLMRSWVDAFREQDPKVSMQVVSRGSATAPAALIEGSADLGPMARPMKSAELEKFTSRYGFQPTQIRTAIAAVGVYVPVSNPIEAITFEQLDAIYSANRKRGAKQTLATWGDLGVKGKLGKEAIVPIGLEDETQAASYFRQQVMLQGEFSDKVMSTADNRSMMQALTANPNGIAFGEVGQDSPNPERFKPLRITKGEGDPALSPTEANLKSGNYPLARFLNIYIVRYPGEPIESSLGEFLRFVLSPTGQTIARREGLIPLPLDAVNEELTKLR